MRLQLPPPTNSQIKTAEFVKSSVAVSDCPQPKYPEFAVIGRSNVGKSSLINLLTNRKSLAMVSKQPGVCRRMLCHSQRQLGRAVRSACAVHEPLFMPEAASGGGRGVWVGGQGHVATLA